MAIAKYYVQLIEFSLSSRALSYRRARRKGNSQFHQYILPLAHSLSSLEIIRAIVCRARSDCGDAMKFYCCQVVSDSRRKPLLAGGPADGRPRQHGDAWRADQLPRAVGVCELTSRRTIAWMDMTYRLADDKSNKRRHRSMSFSDA
jgi:hypothetical protein